MQFTLILAFWILIMWTVSIDVFIYRLSLQNCVWQLYAAACPKTY